MNMTDQKMQPFALPEAFAARMASLLGDEYPAYLASYGKPLRPSLRLNPLRGEAVRTLTQIFSPEPIPWVEGGYYYPDEESVRPGKHAYHEAGAYYIQEASAMIPASLCPPVPGERVLDLCAAPGGKATQLAGALMGKGLLVANEIHAGRAAILSQNLERMGVPNALVTNDAPAALAARFPGFFDKIVVDAPCSGEGMFRKEEQALTMWSPDNVRLCAARQDEILAAAAIMLRPGGYLTYSTCTFAPEENEGTLLRFLRTHPDFDTVAPQNPRVSECLAAGVLDHGQPDWIPGGEEYAESLRRAIRLFPHHADGEGHFAVLLRRAEATSGAPSASTPVVPAASSRPRPSQDKKRAKAAPDPSSAALSAARDLLREGDVRLPEGIPCLFGDQLYLLPPEGVADASDLQGLRVLRAGLHVGTLKNGRFEPAHALAMSLTPAQTTHVFALDTPTGQAATYLHGDTLPCPGTLKGWYLITVDGLPLGWGKAGGGVMKNHYPKGLRKII